MKEVYKFRKGRFIYCEDGTIIEFNTKSVAKREFKRYKQVHKIAN